MRILVPRRHHRRRRCRRRWESISPTCAGTSWDTCNIPTLPCARNTFRHLTPDDQTAYTNARVSTFIKIILVALVATQIIG